ncbi:linear amide C-N hydrolase [Rhodobacteraceae bacterium RKSG542]|uniref:linear amide C-N hydrolase n=1 Tax=Pseudovibrio flavus TaxID=2529854 RepID=UPI0012BC6CD5|nr:linear amide C-N hydrolase [Pseudovibrio flavus]MTI17439.1 linear amide C-N hydrolase [Pseudovibrio flavus]
MCTRIFLNHKDGSMLCSRSLDFFSPVNPSIMKRVRGVKETSSEVNGFEWTSKYGSVVVYANGVFPMDGMNEVGLGCHTLYYDNGSQITNKPDLPMLDSCKWLVYILDNFETVADAVSDISAKINLRAAPLEVEYATDTKHIAIEDKTGDSAIIQIDDGEMKIYHCREKTRILTNPPAYSKHMEVFAAIEEPSLKTIPWSLSSTDRFVRSNMLIDNLPPAENNEQLRAFLMSIAYQVAYPFGMFTDPLAAAVTERYIKYNTTPEHIKGPGTYWYTMIDFVTNEYIFKSTFNFDTLVVKLSDLDFDAPECKVLDNSHVYSEDRAIDISPILN